MHFCCWNVDLHGFLIIKIISQIPFTYQQNEENEQQTAEALDGPDFGPIGGIDGFPEKWIIKLI